MASLLNSYDSKLTKPLPKPLMLKDYLLDDLSSSSTNGFRSYPRRQCCTTVRLLLEMDSKTRDSNRRKISLLGNKSRTDSATMTAFQRALEALIHAVKRLQFPSGKLPSFQKQSNAKNSSLPRSLSRKLLIKRCFWKRNDEENDRWKSIKKSSPEEKEKSSGSFPSAATIIATAAVTADLNLSASESHSTKSTDSYTADLNLSTSESHSTDSYRWTDIEFNSDYLQCSSGNSENSCVTVVENSIEATPPTSANSKNERPKEEDKEQFSPVSVLDFPLDDEEEEVSSPFQQSLTSMKGTKQEITEPKNRRFESLDLLEPAVLEKQFSLSESPDKSLESSFEDENEAQRRAATDLLELLKKSAVRSSTSELMLIKAENLLLEFFREALVTESESRTESATSRSKLIDCEMVIVNEARDWMNGDNSRRRPQEMLSEWELQKNGKTCVREVAVEIEVEVVASLVNELVLDLSEIVT